MIAVLGLAMSVLAACSDAGAATQSRLVLPSLAADSAAPHVRTYGMGWFVAAPEPTVEAVIATVQAMAMSGDYVLIQREVPWDRILAGQTMEQAATEDYDELIAFVRGNGLRLAMLVDPLNGLDRRQEGELLTAAGRSLLEPEILGLHEEWVRLVAGRYKPDYLGLASEINSLAELGSLALYERIREMANHLAPQIRSLSPGTKVFISVQADEAWGKIPLTPVRPVDHFNLANEFDIDVLGVSSYPSFFFQDPSEIPLDYYQRFRLASGKPIIQAEGGWASAGTPSDPRFTPEKQVSYIRRLFDILDAAEAELVILLIYADLDLSHPGWGPGVNVGPGLGVFATMGLATQSFEAKPALQHWRERFRWTRRPP